MRIDVLAADIRHGKPRCAYTCAVSRAVKRATGAKVVGVCVKCITLDAERQFPTPAKVVKWLERFDAEGRKAVKPFSFTLPIKAKR